MLTLLTVIMPALAAPSATHPLPEVFEHGDELEASWMQEDGWFLSPVRNEVLGTTRIGVLLTSDVMPDSVLEVRGFDEAGKTNGWQPLRAVWPIVKSAGARNRYRDVSCSRPPGPPAQSLPLTALL